MTNLSLASEIFEVGGLELSVITSHDSEGSTEWEKMADNTALVSGMGGNGISDVHSSLDVIFNRLGWDCAITINEYFIISNEAVAGLIPESMIDKEPFCFVGLSVVVKIFGVISGKSD